MKIFIVMPVFNEAKRISSVLKDVAKTSLSVVVVNDGSTDQTNPKLKRQRNVTVLTHRVNLGKGAALKTGCDYAFNNGADAVILMDSDGQHDVSDINKFISKLNQGFDIVFGSRNLNLGAPIDRYMGNKVASVLVGILFGIYVSDLICGFKAFTKRAYSKIKWKSSGYGVETEIALRVKKANLKHCEVDVATIYYDNFKGVSITDAFGVLFNIISWRFKL